jgi:hemerythrin
MGPKMNIRSWDKQLETGHAWIDGDHQQVVVLVTQLADAVEKRAAKVVCDTVLEQMIWHTKAHFAAEERLMAEHNYSEQHKHRAEHARLIKDMNSYKAWLDAGCTGLYPPLIDFLEAWWSYHVYTADKELAAAITPAVESFSSLLSTPQQDTVA